MRWLLLAGIPVLLTFAMIYLSQCYRVTRRYMSVQQDMLNTLMSIDVPERITREVALKKARRLKRSRDAMDHLTGLLGFDPGKYFVTLTQNETDITRRLRELGVDPAQVDIPPGIDEIDGVFGGEEVLLPPNPTDGRNADFFQRRRAG